MNTALVALELRKNRLTLIGLALSFCLVPPLSLLVAPRAGYGLTAAVEAGLILWTLAGLPLSAVVLGAAAGAGLRGAEAAEAEAPFPESASARVARGLAGALLQLLILAAATGLLSALVSPGWRSGVLGAGEGPEVWKQVAPLRALVAYATLDLLASSFLASYALGHAVAGGLLGAVLAAAEAALLALGLQYPVFFPDRAESFVPIAVLAVLAGAAAKAGAILPLSARFERRRPLGAAGWSAALGLLLAGLALAGAAEESSYASLRSSLRLAEPRDGYFALRALGPTADEAAAALSPSVYGAGVPADTAAGGLVWIGGDGRVKRLLADAPGGRLEILGPWGGRLEALHRDASGALFVLRARHEPSGDRTELWGGRPESGLARSARDPADRSSLVLRGGRVALESAWISSLRDACVLAAEAGRASCVAAPALAETPGSATLPKGGDRRSVRLDLGRGRASVCRLPGRVPSGFEELPPNLVAGKPAWFVPVERQDDQGVAVCRADGNAELVWKTGRGMLWPLGGLGLEVLPDGTIVHQYGYDWDVVTPDGKFLPPIKSKKLFERWPRAAGAAPVTPRLVRRAGGRAWIVFEGTRLVEIDEASGMPLRDWPLPVRAIRGGSWNGLVVLGGGLVVEGTRAPFFVAWDGAVKALRAP